MNGRGLSPAARAWAIEEILSGVQDRWFERGIRAQATEKDAVRWARSNCNGMGCWVAEGRMRSGYDWIEVEHRDGSRGRLYWRDVVRSARAEAVQGVLL